MVDIFFFFDFGWLVVAVVLVFGGWWLFTFSNF